jgi:hypothetical protein
MDSTSAASQSHKVSTTAGVNRTRYSLKTGARAPRRGFEHECKTELLGQAQGRLSTVL